VATLLCGDFNIAAGSPGYMIIAGKSDFEDQFLRWTAPDVFARLFRGDSAGKVRDPAEDGRIDYVFLRKNNALKPSHGRTLFTGRKGDYREVSDHPGYIVEFEPE
jgi:maltose 6'-phosphate phosphatase